MVWEALLRAARSCHIECMHDPSGEALMRAVPTEMVFLALLNLCCEAKKGNQSGQVSCTPRSMPTTIDKDNYCRESSFGFYFQFSEDSRQ